MPRAHAAEQVDRRALVDWFQRSRERSRQIFAIVSPNAYYAQPIPLRHPIAFYDGHLAAFNLNTLVKRGLGRPGIDARLETLFARGIDPDQPQDGPPAWPAREEVRAFVAECDRRVLDALVRADIDQPGHPLLHRAQAAYAILEHEAMHQETLLYILHRLPYAQKRETRALGRLRAGDASAGPGARGSGLGGTEVTAFAKAAASPPELQRRRKLGATTGADGSGPSGVQALGRSRPAVRIPAGRATLGANRDAQPFGWDNEFSELVVDVPAFTIDVNDVTNGAYMEFVEAGGYDDPRWWSEESFRRLRTEGIRHPLFWERSGDRWMWRGMFEGIPLPLSWPVYVSQAEASAFARWAGGRLPTEAEYHRAAYGTPAGEERPFPWGSDEPAPHHGCFDFAEWDPVPAGAHPAGRSAWGVEDLVGNGWEWTSTVFDRFPGFEPTASYPEYSVDFFDGRHYVIKGASPATARELLRRSFRNWFRPEYPYVYATFRCVG